MTPEGRLRTAYQAAASYTEEQYARAVRIGRQVAEAINSGRVDLSRPDLRGTLVPEPELLAQCEALMEKLKRRDAGRA